MMLNEPPTDFVSDTRAVLLGYRHRETLSKTRSQPADDADCGVVRYIYPEDQKHNLLR